MQKRRALLERTPRSEPKTLLAKAVASEGKITITLISGSDFVGMFVGGGRKD